MMKHLAFLLPSLLVGAAAWAAMAPSPAAASPQVLGLVAMNEPLTMKCDETGCRAELSSFCLQQPRDNPPPQTAYLPTAGADISLIGTRADGSTIALPAADYMQFEASRGFTSVRASLDPVQMQSLGLVSVAIEVGSEVSLLPAETENDPSPQAADEIAIATGVYREKAAVFFDTSGEQADAIRVTNTMINALPEHRSATDSDGTVLAAALDNGIAETVDPGAVQRASDMFALCREKVDVTHHIDNMRECLIGSHDRMVINSNIQFWESLGGS